MIGECAEKHAKESTPRFPFGNEALSLGLLPLERRFFVLDLEGTDASVSVKGNRFGDI